MTIKEFFTGNRARKTLSAAMIPISGLLAVVAWSNTPELGIPALVGSLTPFIVSLFRQNGYGHSAVMHFLTIFLGPVILFLVPADLSSYSAMVVVEAFMLTGLSAVIGLFLVLVQVNYSD